MKQNNLNEYINKFAKLEEEKFERMHLIKGEQVKHCIDDTDARFYRIGWIVTNNGRVWSLNQNRWLFPWLNGKYWRVANTYVHLLINYYFMSEEDKKVLKVLKEHNMKCSNSEFWHLDVHHLQAVQKFDTSKMTKEERIRACMEVNKKENLKYQIKEIDHSDDHRIMKGEKTIGEIKGTEQLDCFASIVRNSGADEVYITYSELGKRQINTLLKLKGTTAEEENKLDKITQSKFLLR